MHLSRNSHAKKFLEMYPSSITMDERGIKQYHEQVIHEAKEGLCSYYRQVMPKRSFLSQKWWQIAASVLIVGGVVGSYVRLWGVSLLLLDILFLGWVMWFRWEHSAPEWESSPFTEFREESPGMYEELMQDLLPYVHKDDPPLEFSVEWHTASPVRFLVLRDCLTGEKFYYHSWVNHKSLAKGSKWLSDLQFQA